jgi:hypothetical protein
MGVRKWISHWWNAEQCIRNFPQFSSQLSCCQIDFVQFVVVKFAPRMEPLEEGVESSPKKGHVPGSARNQTDPTDTSPAGARPGRVSVVWIRTERGVSRQIWGRGLESRRSGSSLWQCRDSDGSCTVQTDCHGESCHIAPVSGRYRYLELSSTARGIVQDIPLYSGNS